VDYKKERQEMKARIIIIIIIIMMIIIKQIMGTLGNGVKYLIWLLEERSVGEASQASRPRVGAPDRLEENWRRGVKGGREAKERERRKTRKSCRRGSQVIKEAKKKQLTGSLVFEHKSKAYPQCHPQLRRGPTAAQSPENAMELEKLTLANKRRRRSQTERPEREYCGATFRVPRM
jgi:hypothetical protein